MHRSVETCLILVQLVSVLCGVVCLLIGLVVMASYGVGMFFLLPARFSPFEELFFFSLLGHWLGFQLWSWGYRGGGCDAGNRSGAIYFCRTGHALQFSFLLLSVCQRGQR